MLKKKNTCWWSWHGEVQMKIDYKIESTNIKLSCFRFPTLLILLQELSLLKVQLDSRNWNILENSIELILCHLCHGVSCATLDAMCWYLMRKNESSKWPSLHGGYKVAQEPLGLKFCTKLCDLLTLQLPQLNS